MHWLAIFVLRAAPALDPDPGPEAGVAGRPWCRIPSRVSGTTARSLMNTTARSLGRSATRSASLVKYLRDNGYTPQFA
jgi:hypothetical protein